MSREANDAIRRKRIMDASAVGMDWFRRAETSMDRWQSIGAVCGRVISQTDMQTVETQTTLNLAVEGLIAQGLSNEEIVATVSALAEAKRPSQQEETDAESGGSEEQPSS